jgi:hypothetical protein
VWNNIVKYGRAQMTVWLMRIVFWMPEATNTPSGYAIIFAFPVPKWFGLVTYKGCQIPKQLRIYLIGNP